MRNPKPFASVEVYVAKSNEDSFMLTVTSDYWYPLAKQRWKTTMLQKVNSVQSSLTINSYGSSLPGEKLPVLKSSTKRTYTELDRTTPVVNIIPISPHPPPCTAPCTPGELGVQGQGSATTHLVEEWENQEGP